MATFYCVECAHETDDRRCLLCGERTEPLEVKDDPLLGRSPNTYSYAYEREELL